MVDENKNFLIASIRNLESVAKKIAVRERWLNLSAEHEKKGKKILFEAKET